MKHVGQPGKTGEHWESLADLADQVAREAFLECNRMDAIRLFASFSLLLLCSGCVLPGHGEYWCEPGVPCGSGRSATVGGATGNPEAGLDDLDLAACLDRQCSPDATLYYLRALERLAPQCETASATGCGAARSCAAYRQCLARFLICAQRHGQYVPGTGVVIQSTSETRIVPVRAIGLPWTLEDIQQVHPVGEYYAKSLTRTICRCGAGIPIVALRNCPTGQHPADQYVQAGTAFAVTAVFRTTGSQQSDAGVAAPQSILELRNPQQLGEASPDEPNEKAGPLAADLSAPLVFNQLNGGQTIDPFAWFIHPEMGNGREGLFFMEPYQPGKIPVLLIHGLLSSPTTWVDMANELRAMPGFSERFQIWGFRYATGQPFVASAALLRKSLNAALAELRASGPDPALDHIVLIGHSMGGLIAKAQISCSGDAMWRAMANRPLSQLVATPEMRNSLQERFYFAPQPAIRRVVFVAVPHGGSTLATRFIGQVGSCLVSPEDEVKDQHRQLIADNPGVFSREVRRRIPTSIDLLESRSKILQALYDLPVNQHVTMHSIIGNGRYSPGDGRGDGVVGVHNARHRGVATELLVPATHTDIHRRSETVCEVWRILCEHYEQYLQTGNALALPEGVEETQRVD
jgi:pimeloyl-ACP methyl ester carboxylesterase